MSKKKHKPSSYIEAPWWMNKRKQIKYQQKKNSDKAAYEAMEKMLNSTFTQM